MIEVSQPKAPDEPLECFVARRMFPHAFVTGVSSREQTDRMIEKAQRAIDAIREVDAENRP